MSNNSDSSEDDFMVDSILPTQNNINNMRAENIVNEKSQFPFFNNTNNSLLNYSKVNRIKDHIKSSRDDLCLLTRNNNKNCPKFTKNTSKTPTLSPTISLSSNSSNNFPYNTTGGYKPLIYKYSNPNYKTSNSCGTSFAYESLSNPTVSYCDTDSDETHSLDSNPDFLNNDPIITSVVLNENYKQKDYVQTKYSKERISLDDNFINSSSYCHNSYSYDGGIPKSESPLKPSTTRTAYTNYTQRNVTTSVHTNPTSIGPLSPVSVDDNLLGSMRPSSINCSSLHHPHIMQSSPASSHSNTTTQFASILPNYKRNIQMPLKRSKSTDIVHINKKTMKITHQHSTNYPISFKLSRVPKSMTTPPPPLSSIGPALSHTTVSINSNTTSPSSNSVFVSKQFIGNHQPIVISQASSSSLSNTLSSSSPKVSCYRDNIPSFVSTTKKKHLLQFIIDLLYESSSTSIPPSDSLLTESPISPDTDDVVGAAVKCVKWIDQDNKEFQISQPDKLAKLWAKYKNNNRMTFDSLARSLRLYYAPGKLERVSGKKNHYRILAGTTNNPVTINSNKLVNSVPDKTNTSSSSSTSSSVRSSSPYSCHNTK